MTAPAALRSLARRRIDRKRREQPYSGPSLNRRQPRGVYLTGVLRDKYETCGAALLKP